jgi:hypothetical protein
MKLNWGHYIAIFFSCFVIFILTLVYKTFAVNIDLVSEDYYAKEIAFQDKIDKLESSKKMSAIVSVYQGQDSIEICFPEQFNSISGSIQLFRPSDVKLDVVLPIVLKNHKQKISKNLLHNGRYVVHVDWKSDSTSFYTEQEIFIK